MSIPCDPDVVERLRSAKRLQGEGTGGGFAFDLDLSPPALAVAIHAGHRVPGELLPLMQISEKERLFEEDPATDRMIRGCANAVWGLDSRAEYDLNRPAAGAVPVTAEQFWGVQVYRPPDGGHVRRSWKSTGILPFIGSCIRVLLDASAVRRLRHPLLQPLPPNRKGDPDPPLFNSRTALLDRRRWGAESTRGCASWPDRRPGIAAPWKRPGVHGEGELCRRLTNGTPASGAATEIARSTWTSARASCTIRHRCPGLALRRAIAAHAPAADR
jgi:hypothetical protein